jgi:hypothetical protein
MTAMMCCIDIQQRRLTSETQSSTTRTTRGRREADADVELEPQETLSDVLALATDVHAMHRTRSATIADARTARILTIQRFHKHNNRRTQTQHYCMILLTYHDTREDSSQAGSSRRVLLERLE